MQRKMKSRRKSIVSIFLAAALVFTMAPPELNAEASVGDTEEKWVPVSQYVQDNNYDVPADYMTEKTGVSY